MRACINAPIRERHKLFGSNVLGTTIDDRNDIVFGSAHGNVSTLGQIAQSLLNALHNFCDSQALINFGSISIMDTDFESYGNAQCNASTFGSVQYNVTTSDSAQCNRSFGLDRLQYDAINIDASHAATSKILGSNNTILFGITIHISSWPFANEGDVVSTYQWFVALHQSLHNKNKDFQIPTFLSKGKECTSFREGEWYIHSDQKDKDWMRPMQTSQTFIDCAYQYQQFSIYSVANQVYKLQSFSCSLFSSHGNVIIHGQQLLLESFANNMHNDGSIDANTSNTCDINFDGTKCINERSKRYNHLHCI